MELISFIGGGNMARALANGLKRQYPGLRIHIVEPVLAQHAALTGLADAIATQPSRAFLAGSDAIVLAVKPQTMAEACTALASCLSGELVVSIAAGTTLARLRAWLGGHDRLVRTMPNTPALLGAGMSGLYAPEHLPAADVRLASELLAACGKVLRVDSEADIDAITAVSGSGPAYVFHWLEAMFKAAETVGFKPEDARLLVLQTLRGALLLAEQSEEPPSVLRERVTSKGGTTAAALALLSERGVAEAYVAAIKAARQRAEELSRLT
jgi:pyrroline-5-carboxylate reductase (EC 1.5.1.2)